MVGRLELEEASAENGLDKKKQLSAVVIAQTDQQVELGDKDGDKNDAFEKKTGV